ncbi:Na(+) dependent transporter Sodium Bile acid symporter family [Paramagnetospirillum magnetotacticum MS-1]|uniref:Na(+) dependent transporter Sodium Bile acid symporter family n=1 Tax=Paramagnetospirillum magnetotacticum MS-1 TaxID=272627 RepID=A0A0C2UF35_PARME|nr:bile acid:sodium symporter family protein [Paramagnetospirillum magnetotacticum]KIM00088.1 Na(+) dependent transporter Sodium Bile acid symporter family [Paramagnetospirillum magnetotacticum MS-1]
MITQAALPLALAFIMFAMGLTLDAGDFRRVFAAPKAMVVGLAAKLVVLPVLALALVLVWRPEPDFAVGMILLAACPAGVTSALLTHHAGGRIALAATITALTSLAATLTVPLLVNLGLGLFAGYDRSVEIPVAKMTLGIFLVDTVPLALGLGLQRLRPRVAERLGRVARPVATLLFALIVVGAFVSQRQSLMDHVGDVVPAALLLNLAAMTGAWVLGTLARLDWADRIAVVMENGLQNGALGIFVAVTLLGSPAMMVPSIVYAFVMNLTAIAFIVAVRRRRRVVTG